MKPSAFRDADIFQSLKNMTLFRSNSYGIVLHLGIENNILHESANNVFVFISDKCETINI